MVGIWAELAIALLGDGVDDEGKRGEEGHKEDIRKTGVSHPDCSRGAGGLPLLNCA